MRGACVAALALASLSSCYESEPAPPPEAIVTSSEEGMYAPERVPGGIPLTSVGDLLGEYRVAGIDDRELAGNTGIAVSVDGALLSYEPTCAGFVWTVDFESEAFKLKRFREPTPEVAPGEIPVPERAICAIGVRPQWQQLADALDAATRAERTPANAIRLSGGGRSVTLFAQ